MPRASCLVPAPVVPRARASCLVPRASRLVFRASCRVPRARACRASCLVPRVSCLVHCAPCPVPRASCLVSVPRVCVPRAPCPCLCLCLCRCMCLCLCRCLLCSCSCCWWSVVFVSSGRCPKVGHEDATTPERPQRRHDAKSATRMPRRKFSRKDATTPSQPQGRHDARTATETPRRQVSHKDAPRGRGSLMLQKLIVPPTAAAGLHNLRPGRVSANALSTTLVQEVCRQA